MFFSSLSILKGCYKNPILVEMNMLEKSLKNYASVKHYYYDYDPFNSIFFSYPDTAILKTKQNETKQANKKPKTKKYGL